MQKTILSFSVIIALAAIATTQVVLHNTAFASNVTTAVVKGNNGTLKVHEIGTPTAFEDNDPKVCSFNFEGFGFDASQGGYIVLTT